MNHQYLAMRFFNDVEIKKIQQSNDATIVGNSNPSNTNTLSRAKKIRSYNSRRGMKTKVEITQHDLM